MTRMIILLVGVLSTSQVFAQFLTPRYTESLHGSAIFLEVGGNGDHYSLNFDNLFVKGEWMGASARFGLSAMPVGEEEIDFSIPITVSGLIGKKFLLAEIGAGSTFLFDTRILETGTQTLGTGILGIRYHPTGPGGIFLKAAYTPFYNFDQQTIRHHGGFAIGLGI
ncbi:MAG: hypothetical protein AAGI38_02120 [Bacteroidota bacterium]